MDSNSDCSLKAQPFECMQYFYRRVQDPLIRCWLGFRGRIDIDVLRAAVDASIEAMPLIACTFDASSRSWKRRGYDAQDVVCAFSGDETRARAALMSSLGYDDGPRMKVFVVSGAADDVVCIVVDHMLCDGVGYKTYLYLLAGLYGDIMAGRDTAARLSTVPLDRRFSQVTHALAFPRKVRALFTAHPGWHADDPLPVFFEGLSDERHLSVSVVESDCLAAVKARARCQGATVNDVLIAAYARVLARESGCRDIVLPCPVDLRKYGEYGQHYGICNLASNYFYRGHIEPDDAFADTLKDVSRQLQEQKDSDGCLKGPLLLHAMARLLPLGPMEKLFFRTTGVPQMSYTNIGILDQGRLDFGGSVPVRAYLATAVKRAPCFQLSVSTYRGACTLTSSLYAAGEDARKADALIDGVRKELQAFGRE